MDSDVTTKLCSACSKHTLQSLHRGTHSYSLNKDCDLCGLIWEPLNSHLKQNGDGNTMIYLRVAADLVELAHPEWLESLPYRVKTYLEATLQSLFNSISFNLKGPPIGLLSVHNSQGRRITYLKATPLDGKLDSTCLRVMTLTISQARGASSGLM